MRFSPILFNFAFSTAASTAYGSISRQKADFAPHNSEQIASIPLPHPASRSVVSGLIYFLRDKRQSFVVSCVPVPKAETRVYLHDYVVFRSILRDFLPCRFYDNIIGNPECLKIIFPLVFPLTVIFNGIIYLMAFLYV